MTIKFKLVAALALVLGLFAFTSGVTFLTLRSAQPDLDKAALDAGRISASDLPLLLVIKEIKVDVIQVQQWITDYSATRAQDGLDDGLAVAEEYAQKFRTDVATARSLSGQMELQGIGGILDRIEKEFGPYYEAGKRMGQTYADYGPSEGNKMMEAFDAVAATIGDSTDKLVEMAEQQTRASLNGLAKDTSRVRDANATLSRWIVFLTKIGRAHV